LSAPTEIIVGRYRLEGSLGAGGMGEVFKARDTSLDRTVAIKFVAGAAGDSTANRRLVDEARAASALNHPNVCTIHEIGLQQDRPYIVMEFVGGQPLKKLIPPGGLAPEMVVRYGIQIAEAIAHAHEKGVVHGDLKTANVMVTEDGRVKVLDFGLARRVAAPGTDDTTRTGDHNLIEGTLPYMAPERLRGQPPQVSSDIWALGVILHEMSSGELPFAADTDADLCSAILRDPPRDLTRSLPSTLRAVVHRTLSKDPALRYHRAADLTAVLDVLRADPQVGTPAARARRPTTRRTRKRAIRRIAVLPLENLSGDAGQDYFADGLTEAVTAQLARIKSLRVTSRTSVMRYRNAHRPAAEIAAELGVDALIEGSVLRFGDRVRISAQLIDAATDSHLWSDSYDRDVRDILALQADVARAVAAEIEGLTPHEARTPAPRRVNPEAYEAYLKGRHFWNRRTEQSMRKGLEAFSHAIDLDPTYPLAYVGQADAFNVLGYYGVISPGDAFPRARAAAERALHLDPGVGEAHTSLGYATFYYDWNWTSAELHFRRSLELTPRYALAHHWYATALLGLGRFDEARREIEAARELDPLSLSINAAVGLLTMLAREFDAAIDVFRRVLELDSTYALAHTWLALAQTHMGRHAEAIDAVGRLAGLAHGSLSLIASAGYCEARAGRRAEAEKVLAHLNEISSERYVSPLHKAVVHIGLGDVDAAFTHLGESIRERSFVLLLPKTNPIFDLLRGDDRFRELLKTAGIA
jgi:eukaryotic-like serine/threonine-protein kinase